MPIFNDYANGKPLKEIDYFIDKIYVDDDGNLSFVIKRYGKDGTKLVEMSADELIENQGFTRFDNFTLCSTTTLEADASRVFFTCKAQIRLFLSGVAQRSPDAPSAPLGPF